MFLTHLREHTPNCTFALKTFAVGSRREGLRFPPRPPEVAPEDQDNILQAVVTSLMMKPRLFLHRVAARTLQTELWATVLESWNCLHWHCK
jgi:hypothetical protein